MAEEKKEEGKEEEAKEAAPKPKKSNTMMIVAIVGVLVLLIAIAIPVFIMMNKKVENHSLGIDAADGGDVTIQEEGSGDEDELEEGEEPMGALFPLDTFVVNLAGGSFVRCQVQLEFTGREIPKRFYSKLVPLRDQVITLLAGRRKEDVANKEGRDSLKNEIREAANDAMKKEEIKNVYFTQFVIQ